MPAWGCLVPGPCARGHTPSRAQDPARLEEEAGVNHLKAMLHRCSETRICWDSSCRQAMGPEPGGHCSAPIPGVEIQNKL